MMFYCSPLFRCDAGISLHKRLQTFARSFSHFSLSCHVKTYPYVDFIRQVVKEPLRHASSLAHHSVHPDPAL